MEDKYQVGTYLLYDFKSEFYSIDYIKSIDGNWFHVIDGFNNNHTLPWDFKSLEEYFTYSPIIDYIFKTYYVQKK